MSRMHWMLFGSLMVLAAGCATQPPAAAPADATAVAAPSTVTSTRPPPPTPRPATLAPATSAAPTSAASSAAAAATVGATGGITAAVGAAPGMAAGKGNPYACRLRTADAASVAIYMQPSLDAEVFATLGNAVLGEVRGRTTDGWYAIDPGVAQAGNVGIYRLRWVRADAPVVLEGTCGYIPPANYQAPPLPPGAADCTLAATADVTVYRQYDVGAGEAGTLPLGATVPAVGITRDGWYAIDAGMPQAPNVGLYRLRWISPGAAVTANDACRFLPVISTSELGQGKE